VGIEGQDEKQERSKQSARRFKKGDLGEKAANKSLGGQIRGGNKGLRTESRWEAGPIKKKGTETKSATKGGQKKDKVARTPEHPKERLCEEEKGKKRKEEMAGRK